jgi:hypothetical protein
VKTYYTSNIRLAAILSGLGVPRRKADPTTCHFDTRPGFEDRKFYNFWFDLSDGIHDGLCREIVKAHEQAQSDITAVNLPMEHPFFYMHAALNNRETIMHEIKSEQVVPMRIIEHGNRTLLISDRASTRTKALMRGALNGDYSGTLV